MVKKLSFLEEKENKDSFLMIYFLIISVGENSNSLKRKWKMEIAPKRKKCNLWAYIEYYGQ
jgi:hypothetical protein